MPAVQLRRRGACRAELGHRLQALWLGQGHGAAACGQARPESDGNSTARTAQIRVKGKVGRTASGWVRAESGIGSTGGRSYARAKGEVVCHEEDRAGAALALPATTGHGVPATAAPGTLANAARRGRARRKRKAVGRGSGER